MGAYQLPKTLDFAPTFKAVLREVADNDTEQQFSFSYAGGPAGIREGYIAIFGNEEEAKEAFDMDLANALGEAQGILGIGEAAGAETGDWLGELYDLAEELGYSWYDEEDE